MGATTSSVAISSFQDWWLVIISRSRMSDRREVADLPYRHSHTQHPPKHTRLWVKKDTQHGALVNGNMDYNLRSPSGLVWTHSHFEDQHRPRRSAHFLARTVKPQKEEERKRQQVAAALVRHRRQSIGPGDARRPKRPRPREAWHAQSGRWWELFAFSSFSKR